MNRFLAECVEDCELSAAIEACSTVLHVDRDRVLFRQNQAASKLFLFKAGHIVLTCRQADESVLGLRAVRGSLIGLAAIASNQPYTMTGRVTKDSVLHSISLGTFRELVGRNPRLSFRVLEIMAAEVRSARVLSSSTLSSVGPNTARAQ